MEMKEKTRYIQNRSVITIFALLLAGCASNQTNATKLNYLGGYTYSGITFGKNLSQLYKRGVRDGCQTAKGYYTKSHRLFNDEVDYYRGWFAGRRRCRDLLIVETD